MANIQASPIASKPFLSVFDDITKARLESLDFSSAVSMLIDNVPAEMLLLLAQQFDVMGYKGWYFAITEDTQRELIKSSINLHQYKGTPYAIKRALAIIGYPNAKIQEHLKGRTYDGTWNFNGSFNYDSPGWPYFRVVLDLNSIANNELIDSDGDVLVDSDGNALVDSSVTLANIGDIIALINEYKNQRSWLYDVSFGVSVIDQILIEEVIKITLTMTVADQFGQRDYDGSWTYNGSGTYSGDTDKITVATS